VAVREERVHILHLIRQFHLFHPSVMLSMVVSTAITLARRKMYLT
jgi:hypothetical protein